MDAPEIGTGKGAFRGEWRGVAAAEPEFASRVQRRVRRLPAQGDRHLRADGRPRISGIEVEFTDDVLLGILPGSLKARDLQRDLAWHSTAGRKTRRRIPPKPAWSTPSSPGGPCLPNNRAGVGREDLPPITSRST